MFLLFIPMLEMILALRGAGAQSVTQPASNITVSEGAQLELKCTFSSSYTPSLFWYAQYPNGELQLLLKYITGNTRVKGINEFEAEFDKSKTSFHLSKSKAHLRDQAMYFCAVSDTVTGTAGGAAQKLLTPNMPQQLKLTFQSAFVSYSKGTW